MPDPDIAVGASVTITDRLATCNTDSDSEAQLNTHRTAFRKVESASFEPERSHDSSADWLRSCEVTPMNNWRKSSYSGEGDGNECVEIANSPTHVSIRDSKAPARAMVTFPAGAFVAFVETFKSDTAHPHVTARVN